MSSACFVGRLLNTCYDLSRGTRACFVRRTNSSFLEPKREQKVESDNIDGPDEAFRNFTLDCFTLDNTELLQEQFHTVALLTFLIAQDWCGYFASFLAGYGCSIVDCSRAADENSWPDTLVS